MSIFAISCFLTGHDWIYHETYRVCEYCDAVERLP